VRNRHTAVFERTKRGRALRFVLGTSLVLTLAASAIAGPVPTQDLADGEAQIRYLGHSGWAIRTKSRFLVFDYCERYEPTEPRSLANGHVDPHEIADLSVVVFVSHGHGDHWDPRILEWEETIPDITYVFGWQAAQGPDHVYCAPERQELTLDNMRVRTIVHDFDGIPEAAFVVEVDGLTIFHSGDHGNGPPPFREAFVENIEYVADIAPEIDVAFIPLWGEESFVVSELEPRFTFPMHDVGREHQYAQFAARAEQEELPTQVIAAAATGDHFMLSNGRMRVSRDRP